MKIRSIRSVGKKPVYDISVQDAEHYILENGVVTHNTGSYYSADNIWIIGRQQDKDADGINGYHFVINVEKSRFVKEKSKIPISVSYDGGINRWSGLVDIALEGGYLAKPKTGWYAVVDRSTGEVLAPNVRMADIIDNDTLWTKMFETTDFAKYIENKFKMGGHMLASTEEEV
jgi:hypothetical protein